MRADEVRERAFAMPLTSPAYPPGPYRFIDREYLIISYGFCGKGFRPHSYSRPSSARSKVLTPPMLVGRSSTSGWRNVRVASWYPARQCSCIVRRENS